MIEKLLQVVKMLPAIVEFVRQAEEFVPVSGSGKAKLEFVLGAITDVVGDVTGLIEPITKIVTRLVALANSTGVFRKAS